MDELWAGMQVVDMKPAPAIDAPPADLESESAFVANLAWLGTGHRATALSLMVSEEDFTNPIYGAIYAAIRNLLSRDSEVHALTIKAELETLGLLGRVGGYTTLTEILNQDTVERPEVLAGFLREKSKLRQLISIGHKIADSATRLEPLDQIVSEASEAITRVAIDTPKAQIITDLSDLLDDVCELRALTTENGGRAMTWGCPELDMLCPIPRGEPTLVAARPGTGKCLGRGTPVLMFDGSIKPVEAIQNGELVMGPDSKPRLVRGVTSGLAPMYRIVPVKGDPWVCNGPHILSLVMSVDRSAEFKKGRVYNISVDDYMRLPGHIKCKLKLYRSGVDFAEQDTKLPPYIMGVWLGDGTTKKPQVTCPDMEVLLELYEYAFANGLEPTIYVNANHCPSMNFRRAPGVKTNHMTESISEAVADGGKRVPISYLRNSRKKRLELLAGLVDTDGYVHNGCIEITTKWEGLRDDILYLARSLGFMVTYTHKRATIKSIGFEGYYWKVSISGETSEIPTRIARKAPGERKINKDATRTGFDIEPIGVGEYFGFELDSDHLFLLGDFTVTHNTAIAVQILCATAASGIGKPLFLSLEMGRQKVKARIAAHLSGSNSRMFRDAQYTDREINSIRQNEHILRGIKTMFPNQQCPVEEIESLVKYAVDVHGIDCVVLDQFSHIHAPREAKKETFAISNSILSQRLTALAKNLNLGWVTLGQINRDGEDSRRPTMKDLADTDRLAKDSAVIFGMWNKGTDDDQEVWGTIIKNRDDGHKGWAKKLNVNYGTCTFRVEEQETVPFLDKQSRFRG